MVHRFFDDLYLAISANKENVIYHYIVIFLISFVIAWVIVRAWLAVPQWFAKIPGPECPSLLFGHMLMLIKSQDRPFELFEKWAEEYGGISKHNFFFKIKRVHITDPAALRHVYVTNQSNYKKAAVPGNATTEIVVGREGLVFSNGAYHKRHRKILTPIFKVVNLKKMVPMLEEKVSSLIELWRSKCTNDPEHFVDLSVQEDIGRMTLDAVGHAAFGYDFNCIAKESEMSKVWDDLLHLSMDVHPLSNFLKFIPFWEYVPTPANLKFWSLLSKLHRLIDDMIEEKQQLMKSLEGAEKAQEDLLGMMLQAVDPEGSGDKLSTLEVREEAKTFLAAGHETTSLGLSWALYELAMRPDIQKKCRDEIAAILPRQNITWEDLDNLKYVTCVVKETLRLHSPAPAGLREAINDDYIGGYFIPKGTIVLTLQGVTHKMSVFWKDPTKFDPDRFIDESQIQPYTYLPFSAGNRMCIGHRFAMAEMVLCLAVILRHFEFQPHPTIKYVTRMVITQSPFPALRLLVKPVHF